MRLIESKHYLSWSGKFVRDIMMAHPNSINLLRMFHRVLIMNNTYKTNWYRLSLLEIVSVTSIELAYSVAFACLSAECYDNFRCAMQMLRDLFVVDSLLPQVFLTDIDIVLMNAIDVVFPSALNLFCRFHIRRWCLV